MNLWMVSAALTFLSMYKPADWVRMSRVQCLHASVKFWMSGSLAHLFSTYENDTNVPKTHFLQYCSWKSARGLFFLFCNLKKLAYKVIGFTVVFSYAQVPLFHTHTHTHPCPDSPISPYSILSIFPPLLLPTTSSLLLIFLIPLSGFMKMRENMGILSLWVCYLT